jgi:hypothetical protein
MEKPVSQNQSPSVVPGVSPGSRNAATNTGATTVARVEETPAAIDSQKVWQQVLAKIPAKGFCGR